MAQGIWLSTFVGCGLGLLMFFGNEGTQYKSTSTIVQILLLLVQKYEYCFYQSKCTNYIATHAQIHGLGLLMYVGHEGTQFTSTKVQILTLRLVNEAILRTRYILILLALLVQKYKY